jgi:hypothetical protein
VGPWARAQQVTKPRNRPDHTHGPCIVQLTRSHTRPTSVSTPVPCLWWLRPVTRIRKKTGPPPPLPFPIFFRIPSYTNQPKPNSRILIPSQPYLVLRDTMHSLNET